MTNSCLTDLAPRVLCLVSLCLTACSSRAGDVVMRSIPGTEQVGIDEFCITVSPDEQWLTFVEWKFPRKTIRKQLPPDEYDTRVTSLNLQTGARTRHVIESISPTALGYSPDDRQWKYGAGFSFIKERFRPPGWRAERFYFQRYYGGTYVAINPSKPDVEIAAEPDSPGTCSDCPPATSVQFRDHSWDLLSNDVSAVFREDAVRTIYYRGEGPYRTLMILRLRAVGEEEVIVKREERKGTMMIIAGLRVSPDERYLAYTVSSQKQAFLAGPREETFIMDLQSRKEKRVARHSYTGNLIWSPDSQRLYLAGGEYASDSAVRVVDVAATFSR